MEVKVNTIISFRYRFLNIDKRPLQRGRWFSVRGMVGGEDLPDFLSDHLVGKKCGDIVIIPLEKNLPEFGGFEKKIIPKEALPDRQVNPGDRLSILDDEGASRLVLVLEVFPDHIVAVPLTGNPQKAAFMEVVVEGVRWATPEEFINRRACKTERCHGGS